MVNEQLMRELEEYDADELVDILGLTTEDLLKAFPDHVAAYAVALQEVDLEEDDEDNIGVYLDDDEEDDDNK